MKTKTCFLILLISASLFSIRCVASDVIESFNAPQTITSCHASSASDKKKIAKISMEWPSGALILGGLLGCLRRRR